MRRNAEHDRFFKLSLLVTMKTNVHAKINVRAMLQASIQQDFERMVGGPNNKTVKSAQFQEYRALKANYLVNGIKPFRV